MSLKVNIKKKISGFSLTVDFELKKGCLAILGASGSGKTMTLKAIAGLLEIEEGQIELEEMILFDSNKKINQRPQDRKIGFLFQNYALFPNMTVSQNIAAGLFAKKRKKDQIAETVEQMIVRFQLEGLENRYPETLSGGQQSRVALARIYAYKPKLVLLDEPFSAMDANLKEEMQLELTKTLQEYGGIAILVTHDREEAYRLSDQLMVMHNGMILQKGNTRQVFEKPELIQVAKMTGCKNFSKAKKIGNHEVMALDWDILLETEEVVPDEITNIGIRAHDFYEVSSENRFDKNVFLATVLECQEAPFEWNFLLCNSKYDKQVNKEQRFWYKKEKSMYEHGDEIPKQLYLGIDKKKIMLFKDFSNRTEK